MLKLSKNAVYSGIAASLGSYFGKLPSKIPDYVSAEENQILCYVFQGLSICLMLGANAMVWTFFVKALQESNTTLATVTSSGVNYLLSVCVTVKDSVRTKLVTNMS